MKFLKQRRILCRDFNQFHGRFFLFATKSIFMVHWRNTQFSQVNPRCKSRCRYTDNCVETLEFNSQSDHLQNIKLRLRLRNTASVCLILYSMYASCTGAYVHQYTPAENFTHITEWASPCKKPGRSNVGQSERRHKFISQSYESWYVLQSYQTRSVFLGCPVTAMSTNQKEDPNSPANQMNPDMLTYRTRSVFIGCPAAASFHCNLLKKYIL
jgi:hypothetical protein